MIREAIHVIREAIHVIVEPYREDRWLLVWDLAWIPAVLLLDYWDGRIGFSLIIIPIYLIFMWSWSRVIVAKERRENLEGAIDQ